MRIEILSQVTLKNMRKHHMRMKNGPLKLQNIISRHILLWTWTKGCSQIYLGDIEIKFENVDAIQSSHKHEDKYLVTDNEEPRSTSPSPLELQVVDQIKKKEEEEFHSHEPSFIEGSLNMSEMDIHEALSILHHTKALM